MLPAIDGNCVLKSAVFFLGPSAEATPRRQVPYLLSFPVCFQCLAPNGHLFGEWTWEMCVYGAGHGPPAFSSGSPAGKALEGPVWWSHFSTKTLPKYKAMGFCCHVPWSASDTPNAVLFVTPMLAKRDSFSLCVVWVFMKWVIQGIRKSYKSNFKVCQNWLWLY